jgi:uncharacterized protein YhfF
MLHTASVQVMWEAYLLSLGEDPATTDKTFSAWYFSDNQQDADSLAALVKTGRKCATTSALWAYENEEPIPIVGEYSVIINWDGEAQCIIQTTQVDIVPFNEVTADYARTEGDRSLDYWRRVHWSIFSRELFAIGKRPEDAMPVICENFKVVF